jgi:hypothetical protein
MSIIKIGVGSYFTRCVMRIVPAILTAAASLVGIGSAASAQSAGDVAAFFALASTPPAALAPLISPVMLGNITNTGQLALRYGRYPGDGSNLNMFAGSIALPLGDKAGMGLTLGYLSPDCGQCDGNFMAGLSGTDRLARIPLGASEGATLNVGILGELGGGWPKGGTELSASTGLPLALIIDNHTVQIAPFLTPALGWGRISGGGASESGSRFLLGGGVGLFGSTTGFGVDVGFQKVFIDQGKTTFGLNLVFGL